MTKLRANKPPPNCLPEAVQLPTVTHTHTHLNLLMSRCCRDTQHKSSNLPDIACEIEKSTAVRETKQDELSLSGSVSHGRMLPIRGYPKTSDL